MGYEISANPKGIRIEVTDYQAGIAFISWGEVMSLKERSRYGHARLEEPIVLPESKPLPAPEWSAVAAPPPAPLAAAPPAPAPLCLTTLEEEIWGQGEGRGDFAKDD